MRRQPFDEIERLLDELFRTLIDGPWGRLPQTTWQPTVDLAETDEAYIAVFDLPGVHPEDIQLRIDPFQIAIQGCRRKSACAESACPLRQECCAGDFLRTVALQRPVDPDSVRSQCQHGVCQIWLRKKRGSNDSNSNRKDWPA